MSKCIKRLVGAFLAAAYVFCSYGVLFAGDYDAGESGNEYISSEETEEETSVSDAAPEGYATSSDDSFSETIVETVETVAMTETAHEDETGVPAEQTTPEETTAPANGEESVSDALIDIAGMAADADTDMPSPVGLTETVLDHEGNTYNVTATYGPETGLPSDASLEVHEIESGEEFDQYLDKASSMMDGQQIGSIRVFDISIVKDGVELEPAEGTTVNVSIRLQDAIGNDINVIHFDEQDEPEFVEISDVINEDGTEIVFEADGFSAYAIVEGPESGTIISGWKKITSVGDLPALSQQYDIYLGNPGGYYFTDGVTEHIGGPTKTRTGITKTRPAENTPGVTAVPYHFDYDSTTGKFKIWCEKEGTPYYIVQNSDSLNLTSTASQATSFTISQYKNGNNNPVTGSFNVTGDGSKYFNMQNGATVDAANNKGVAFAAYQGATDTNAQISFWYYDEELAPSDPYDLDGKKYGFMYYDTGVAGKGMMDTSSSAGSLDSVPMPVLTHKDSYSDKLFVPNDSDITLWSFEWYSDDLYFIKTGSGDDVRYLTIGADGVSLSSERKTVRVVPGSDGKIALSSSGYNLTYSGNVETGFETGGPDKYKWLNLVELSELTSDYLMTYTARKISVSDQSLTNGSRVILYTRVWNEEKKKYDFYAVDHDGTLYPCYEEGDEIQWIGDRINTLLWDFVVYYWDPDAPVKEENYYYELYNEYSEKYICPMADTTEVFSSDTIGINLGGRQNGDYYSNIVAWDDPDYSYAGVKVDNGRIVSCPVDETDDFYFAVIQDASYNDELHTVDTVDNNTYGIKMKMIDFNVVGGKREQSEFLGSNDGTANVPPMKGLLSTSLGSDGYPTAAYSDPKNPNPNYGHSLKELYDETRIMDVNHLFIESTYKSSGYFEYDSTQNFASLQRDSRGNFIKDESGAVNFDLYQEIATMDNSKKPSLQHGQFMPYNTIESGIYSTNNKENLYTATQEELPDSDPRKHEKLLLVNNPDYQFGMELETSFVQTPNGLDDWGHDVIYEFTGDDDFWLYVDGELVIDLGGIHSALYGSINYCTGEVIIQDDQTDPSIYMHYTLYDIFHDNYVGRGHTEEEAAEYLESIFKENSKGQMVFQDYTSHTMKIFFMERGAGASNLKMRFNQSSVKPGTIILSKELSGVDSSESFYAEFPYQIWYQPRGEEGQELPYRLLGNTDEDILVYYKGTKKPVDFEPSYIVDGIEYENVFFLKPGESAEIMVPDEIIQYKIVECGVNSTIYNHVLANDTEITGTTPSDAPAGSPRKDYEIGGASVKERPSVTYENQVNPEALRTLTFKKFLWNENGIGEGNELLDEDAVFDFRLYFATEFDDGLTPANMYIYHVKDKEGHYCRWDSATQTFVHLDSLKTDYTTLTDAEKRQASFTTSMNGAISKIPAYYTVEVREILAGTQFQVEERYNEIPDGFSRIKYTIYEDDEDTVGIDNDDEAIDSVEMGKDPHVEIHNLKGYGLRVYKNWSDSDYMSQRDDTFYAIYIGDQLDPSTVTRMKMKKNTLYWYYPHLEAGLTLDDYHIYEVKVEDPVIDEDTDKVTSYSSITPVYDNGTISLSGRLKGESVSSSFEYTAHYDIGSVYAGGNIRIDTISNTRPGLDIIKEDWQGQPLAGAKFVLKDENGTAIGTFESDTLGKVTTAYLRKDVDYTLEEIKTPTGYHGLNGPLTIRQNSNGTVTVTGVEADNNYYVLDQSGTSPLLTVKNIAYTFTVKKEDKVTREAVEGVEFALHRQRTVGGVTVVDFYPINGYDSLITDKNGIIPKIDATLPAGTYELREISTPSSYQKLPYYIRFTVSDTGDIRLDAYHPEVDIETLHTDDRLLYTLYIANHPSSSDDLTISKQVTGNMGNKNDSFPVTVTLTDPNGDPYVGTVNMSVNGADPTAVVLRSNSAGKITFEIKDGDTVTLTGLATGTSFEVREDPKGYTSTAYLNGVQQSGHTGVVSGVLPTASTVLFVNSREGIIPTGIGLSFNMIMTLLVTLAAALTATILYSLKRRIEEECR